MRHKIKLPFQPVLWSSLSGSFQNVEAMVTSTNLKRQGKRGNISFTPESVHIKLKGNGELCEILSFYHEVFQGKLSAKAIKNFEVYTTIMQY